MFETLGQYKILDRIGAGGMGEVYRARDTRLGRTVAIKVLASGVASDPARANDPRTSEDAGLGFLLGRGYSLVWSGWDPGAPRANGDFDLFAFTFTPPASAVPFASLSAHPTAGESSHGLGLSIAHEIVVLHGGRIRVESNPGEGAAFIVELPVDFNPPG